MRHRSPMFRSRAPVIVPLALWRAQQDALAARGDVGVWLSPADDPDALAARRRASAADRRRFSEIHRRSRLFHRPAAAREISLRRRTARDRRRAARPALLFACSAASTRSRCATGRNVDGALRRLRRFQRQLSDDRRAGRCRCSAAADSGLDRRNAGRGANDYRNDRRSKSRTPMRSPCSTGSARRYPAVALASSFGAEDMVLTDLIARHALPIGDLHAGYRAPARRDPTR